MILLTKQNDLKQFALLTKDLYLSPVEQYPVQRMKVELKIKNKKNIFCISKVYEIKKF